jgi:predicted N-formylglutamate amidohydrolase
MFVLSCEPATCAVPEWHKELFRGHEETVSSSEGWSPGSLNLAQAFATKLRTLLAHGDITRLLVDLSRHPADPARFSRYSLRLTEEQRQKLDDRHLRIFHDTLHQRIDGERQRHGRALHLSLRTAEPLPTAVEIRHSGLELEDRFARDWAAALRLAAPDLEVAVSGDDDYGLSRHLRERHPQDFGSVSLVVAASSFLAGTPVRWDALKKHLLATLPTP